MTIGPYASHISGALASLIIPYVERDNLRGAGSSEEPAPLRSTVLALLPALAPVPVRGRLHVPLPVVAMPVPAAATAVVAVSWQLGPLT